MPKRMSERQLTANRRNALQSTGPRTLKGREVSKMNALKHGILSRQVLVAGQHYQEDREEFEALHRRFWEDLQPEGPLEEMLLDQIVTAHWRLRRALMAESGAIALNVDKGHRKRAKGTPPVLQWMHWRALGDPVNAMQTSSIGSAILLGWMKELRTTVEQAGQLTEEAVQNLAARFGTTPNPLTSSLDELRLKLESGPETSDAVQRKRDEALAFLNREINSLQWSRERCVEDEEHEAESRQAAAVLPSGEVLDKILRYETKLERQLYRAMAQLERVQRMRRGEAIPAPLSVEVAGRE
jgi:hypothetical protein